jgi:hypothetical protein
MIAISYRREDSLPVAGHLYDRMEQRFGKQNVFMDFDSIRPGFDFRDQIKGTIERSKVVIAVIGPHWLGEQSDGSRRIDDPADFVRLEVACALERGIPVIPVLINNTAMPTPKMLPADIQALAFRHALPLDSGLDFRQHADRLISSISDTVGLPSSPPAVTSVRKPEYRLVFGAVTLGVAIAAMVTVGIIWPRNRSLKSETPVGNSLVSAPESPIPNVASAQAALLKKQEAELEEQARAQAARKSQIPNNVAWAPAAQKSPISSAALAPAAGSPTTMPMNRQSRTNPTNTPPQ